MKEMHDFLVQESALIDLKILKYSMWHSENNNINLDILVEKADLSPTNLDDCTKVNKLALLWLKNNNLANRTNLCVRAPGLDRELFSIEDFIRFIGEKVQVELKELTNNRKRLKGFIKSVECDLITLETDSEKFEIQWDLIEKASIVPDWDKIMKEARKKTIRR